METGLQSERLPLAWRTEQMMMMMIMMIPYCYFDVMRQLAARSASYEH